MKKHTFTKLALGIVAGLTFGANTLLADSIHPISREMGSGTRGAFVEIFGIQKEVKGKKIDATTTKAEVTNSTGVMITSIANSKNAIGYISLGSLNDTIKALKVDGVAPSVENINNKNYKISRPFNVVTKAGVDSTLAADFLAYAINAKAVIEKAGYIANKDSKFSSKKPSGKLVIAGSSSVTPLMEKLAESYKSVNPNATLEILQSDSTTGINSVLDGIADIGMVSRELKEAELKKGLKVQVLATDGLAIIVNKANALDSISKESVKKIFMGEVTKWQEVK
ncbi:substrate-binding domain-containing protein [uncultured Helicobacter sp.]|uniref:substrate-binding domain-containing protein n=1 Tax=uncultured Helicobacter sp. TaxID=175537 RepID=UPI00374EB212